MDDMKEHLPPGTWVRIQCTALCPDDRASHLPRATARSPLLFLVNGWTLGEAVPGGQAWIETAAGRRVRGSIAGVNPRYEHGFGRPHPTLQKIGPNLRCMLQAARDGGES